MARGVALAALLLACAAEAQNQGSVSDYQLPPAPSSTSAPAEGPVDKDHPVAAPTSPTPQASPSPAASAAPSAVPEITLPASPTPGPSARPQPAASQPTAVPTPAASASPELLPTPQAEPSPAASVPPAETATATPKDGGNSTLWLLLGGLAVLLVLVGGLLRLRQKPAVPEEMVEAIAAEEAAAAAEEAVPAPSAPAALSPIAPPAAKPIPKPSFGSPVELRFQPQALRLSFVYATLSYRLELANYGESDLTGLHVGGDMISAHASLPNWQQLLLGEGLARKHEIARLARGETASFTGELQLALTEVLPVRAGAAQLFVPLARFLVEAEAGKLTDTHIFSIGQPGMRSDDTMTPFRIDLGPQSFRPIEQREIDLARWLPVDAERRVG